MTGVGSVPGASTPPSTPSADPGIGSSSTPAPAADLVATATNAQKAVAKIVVTTCDGKGSGTGFFVDGRRLVTAAHVVDGATKIRVQVAGATYNASVSGRDDRADVAMVTLTQGNFTGTPLTFADDEPPKGAPVAAIGYPGGGALTFTRGSVKKTDASVRVVDDGIKRTRMVKTDALVSPGNSGGPLVGVDGKVYGIVHAGQIYSTAFGWAVSPVLAADMARAWLADPQRYDTPTCSTRAPSQTQPSVHPSSWPTYDYVGPPGYDICQSAPYPFQDVLAVRMTPPYGTSAYWAITSVQATLRALNYGSPTTIDGDYGPMTASAVRSFQRNKGLVVDGEVGPQTWGMLVTTAHSWYGLCP